MYLSLKPELSAKTTHWLSHEAGILAPYGFAVVAMAAAMGLRIALTAMFGPGLPAFITFYPIVMTVALLAGFGPGLMATAVSAGIVMYYILTPAGQFTIASPIDRVGLVIYIGMGLFMSIVAEFYRRYRAKALVYDNEMKLRESQQALRDSEERNQLIVDSTRDYAIFMLDPQGRIATWNPGAERIKGYQAEEIIGQHFSCFYHKEAVESDWPAQELQIAEAEGRCEDVGWRIRKDGSRFWADVIITRLFDDAGHLKGFSKITRDLTQQKHAEEMLNESKRRVEGILGSAMDAIISVDGDQRIVLFNAAAEKMFRCAANEAIGTPVERFIPNRARSAHAAHIRHFAEAGTTSRAMGRLGDIMGLRADGSEFPIEASISQTEASGNKIFTVILRDITERKHTEEVLSKSQAENEFLASLLRHSSQPLAVGNFDGGVGRVNTAFEKLTGYSEAELRSINWAMELTPSEWQELERDKLAELTRTRQPVRYQKEYVRKNGTRVPIELLVHLETNAEGNPQFYYAFVTDITERKQAEVELAKMQNLLAEGQRIAHLGSWEFIAATHETIWSDEQKRIYGLDPAGPSPVYEEMLRRHIHREDAVHLDRSFGEALENGAAFENQNRIVRPDGGVRWIYNHAQPYFDADGKLIKYIGAILDITERKRVEEALHASEERWRFALDISKMGAWELNLEDNTAWRSLRHDQIFGYEELLPEWTYPIFLQHVLEEDREDVDQKFQRAIAEHLDWSFECRIRRADGAMRWIWAYGKSISDESRHPIRMFGLVLDITERKQTEIAQKDADRQKNEFLAMLGHELRNPLTPISNIAQTLGTLSLNGATIAKVSEMLNRNVIHITHLVDDLLDVSRITRGLVTIDRHPIELGKLLKDTVESVQSFFNVKQQTLKLHLPAQPVYLNGDPVRLTQVFSNLLTNANKFTGEGGRIDLRVNQEGQSVVVRVQDNGIGIEPQLLPHIFGLFTQGEQGLARSGGGLGLGLTLVKNLVDMHGGHVTANSQGANHGAEFVVKLPTSVGAPVQAESAHLLGLNNKSEKSLRILTIDDNEGVVDSISLFLEMLGHQVESASNGTQGIVAAQSFAPDIILLDIGLPDMDGYQVAKKLREQPCTQRVPIIAMSGYSQENDSQGVDKVGFDHYLIKPPKLSELRNLLEGYQRTKLSDRYAQPPPESSG